MTPASRRPVRSPALWLALVAVLASALLPGWAHALGHRDVHRVAHLTEVCSAQGSRWVRVPDPAADTPAHGIAAWLDHCPDCVPALDLPPQAGPQGPSTPPAPRATPRPWAREAGPAQDASARRPPSRGPPTGA